MRVALMSLLMLPLAVGSGYTELPDNADVLPCPFLVMLPLGVPSAPRVFRLEALLFVALPVLT